MKKEFGIIILAAGSSARLGRPKQHLTFNNKTFLQQMVITVTAVNCGPVIIVLGANAQLYNEHGENVYNVVNDKWQQGMGSTICCGLKKLLEVVPDVEGAIITVCDQPYVTLSLLQQMLHKHQQSQLPIVACTYSDTIGTPVLFHHAVFSELLQLSGDKGAKQIVNKDKERVALVDFPLGAVDVDTEEDYTRLLKKENNDYR